MFSTAATCLESAVMPAIAVEVNQAARRMQARHLAINFGCPACLLKHGTPFWTECQSGRRRLNFVQAPLEKSAFAAIGDQRQRPFVALCRFCCGSDST